jgi:ABC-type glycerol-3-phosphate transport system permease component
MFQDQVGIINYVASSLSLISEPILSDQTLLLIGAILVDTWKTTPFMALLLLAGLQVIPGDLYEAAKVDGATTLQAFRLVIVPLAAPGVFTAAILTFIHAWNEFLFANTFLFDERTQPVTVVIPNFATIYTVDYGAQAAAAVVVVTVPLVVLVLVFQRRIISGLTAGAVKG